MTLLLNNADIQRVLTPQMTRDALDMAYRQLAVGEGVCRPRMERGNIQGVQFYAVAAAAFEEARRQGIGRELPTDWFLQDIRD